MISFTMKMIYFTNLRGGKRKEIFNLVLENFTSINQSNKTLRILVVIDGWESRKFARHL